MPHSGGETEAFHPRQHCNMRHVPDFPNSLQSTAYLPEQRPMFKSLLINLKRQSRRVGGGLVMWRRAANASSTLAAMLVPDRITEGVIESYYFQTKMITSPLT